MKKNWIVHGILAVLPDSDGVWLDVHGFQHETALEVVCTVVEAAFSRGYCRVTVVHGAAEITSPIAALHRGRGAIKWLVRRALNQGEYMEWAYFARSKKHERDANANRISLALRSNPAPVRDSPWPEMPKPEFL